MNTVQNALCSKSLNHETVNAVNTPWHGDSLTSDSILFYNMQVNVFWCTNSDMFYKLWTVSWHPNSYITLIVAIINNYVGSQLQNEYFWEQKISSTKKRKDCVCAFVCVCVCGERQRERAHWANTHLNLYNNKRKFKPAGIQASIFYHYTSSWWNTDHTPMLQAAVKFCEVQSYTTIWKTMHFRLHGQATNFVHKQYATDLIFKQNSNTSFHG